MITSTVTGSEAQPNRESMTSSRMPHQEPFVWTFATMSSLQVTKILDVDNFDHTIQSFNSPDRLRSPVPTVKL